MRPCDRDHPIAGAIKSALSPRSETRHLGRMRAPVVLGLLLSASIASAQSGGVIAGLVVDEAGSPVAGADVFVLTQTHRARTDSAGRFEIQKLDGGVYRIRARRVGFLPAEISTDVGKNGRVDVKLELRARPAFLDSVVVVADGKCAELSVAGFTCRKRNGKGVYFTDDDLLDRGAIELGDVFRDVNGFRIEMIPTPFGAKPRPLATRGGRCLNALVNGRPMALTNPLPRYAYDLLAVEIYALPNDVPDEYQRYVSLRTIRQSASPVGQDSPNARCSLVVYWTSYR